MIVFNHPEPTPATTRVWPVFLPFAGCPYRCAFCAQDKQTGKDEVVFSTIARKLETGLEQALDLGRGPYELAFYGGTFTALPFPWPETFLGIAMRFREQGLITRVRCSTRPDCVDPETLADLSGSGLDMIELGIQSFDDGALAASGRGYDGATARSACELVQKHGLSLGIQLLPGLPGDRPGMFQDDVGVASSLRPEIVRLYPCLVIEGTPLATLWREGTYTPWSLERAREELAKGVLELWEHGVRVVRLGLAPEGTLEDNILAGAWHPAFGQSVRGLALLSIVRRAVNRLGRAPSSLTVPERYSGEIFGHGREYAPSYSEIGLEPSLIHYHGSPEFILK